MGKELDKAISDLQKDFGKGVITNFNDEGDQSIKRISSGSIGLDKALGGGWPLGRVVEVMGPESSGKCVSSDAYILTENGYKTVEEIFKERDLELFTTDKDVEERYSLINREGLVESTTHFTYNSKRVVYGVQTKTGFYMKRTYKHPLLVLSKNGNLVWRESGTLQKGDFLAQRREIHFGTKSCDLDLAYSIGLLIADGHFEKNTLPGITNNDPDVIKFIETRLAKALGIDSVGICDSSLNKDGTISYNYYLKQKVRDNFYSKFGLEPGVAKTKYIPLWIRELNKECLASFLRGYLDVESYLGPNEFEVTSASYTLIYQVKLLLSQFGIVSFLKKLSDIKGYEQNDYWALYFSGADLTKFIQEIGTCSSKQRERQTQFLNRNVIQVQTNHDSIPYINSQVIDLYHSNNKRSEKFNELTYDLLRTDVRCTHTRLRKVLEISETNSISEKLSELLDYYFDEVVVVEELPSEPTFDFSMERTHSFIADGCINHNTTVALHSIFECQKDGGVAAFIDAEYAFDPVYAEALGIDTKNNFVFCQPESGEMAFEVLEKLVKSGEVRLVVVDSVAALVPKAELEGDFGDSKMGLAARLMSQGMRKLVGIISKADTCVIFINQYRSNIGVMYGPTEVTTGGNALKYYASIRCDVRRVSQNKDGDVVVSNRTKVKTLKNKTFPPFKECQFDIVFGEGIDYVGEIIDHCVEEGIIKKSGSWFSYGETKLGQGRDAAKQIISDNPELLEELVKKLKL